MIATIFRNEWLRLRRSGVALALALGAVLVLGLAVQSSLARARLRQGHVEAAREAQDADRARLLRRLDEAVAAGKKVGYYDSRSPAYAGGPRGQRFALHPPGPSAWLAVGQSDLHPAALPVSTEARPSLVGDDGQENSEHLAAGGFDPAFVVVVLLPLVVLALSFDLLSGERESGALALVLSHPLSTLRYALLRGLALWIGVMAGTTVALLGCLVVQGGAAAFAEPGVLVAALVVTGAYLAFWIAAAVAVQSRAWNSATNAASLATLWLLLVVVGPAGLNTLVTTLYPAPSRLELVQARRDAARHAEEEGAGNLAQFYQDHPELATESATAKVDEFTLHKLLLADHVAEAVAPLETRFREQSRAQLALLDRLRFLSPAVVTWQALTGLAGTSSRDYQDFADRAMAFRRRWDAFFRPRIFSRKALAREDFERLPTWEETPAAPSGRWREMATGLLGLLLPAVLLVLLAAPGLRRYPARR